MIESFVDGRVRLRSPLFAETDIAEALVECLKTVAGVRKVDFNSRTGGMLLEYDPSRIPQALIVQAAPLLERMDQLQHVAQPQRREGAKGLLGELKNLLSTHS